MSVNTHLSFTFDINDGFKVFARKWVTEENPRAIVQIAHGMAEHIERYDEFAKKLVAEGFSVYGNDHRGHGRTAQLNGMSGYFDDEQGFERVAGDMAQLTSVIERENPNVPIFIFGHSMGSFLSRRYIQLHGNRIAGVILCGTGGNLGLSGKIGRLITRWEIKKHGRQTPSSRMNNLIFGGYNKAFHPKQTDFDWLSRDEKEVNKYIEDPFCGGVFTTGFFSDLLEGIELVNSPQNIKRIPSTLPIFLISGSADPVGNDTKGVLQAYQGFKQAGIGDVTYKFYENARHELLNEVNKEEVSSDIIQWIQTHL
ncbi:alpha/beta hydrolase [Alkalihalobacillus alcalophilus ATCC 27647 = CGMCC 1.3604]|uniref:Alpha/beta hydrolase n=1 Tax=Alkalihalobacillus alcalophilus ATCC 27647 = CGMCC 1.3604 TaxID=1218173 RepID=A0A094WSD7_ALKAL|nr:alpha/beta hydrolase [Alkalihalobacillus alcalophilus]KGA98978.1 alpha/beta hydrolase [Alkalihalobacillus alcalophilus ATCC 27647 = CGMCC 1.3604]MED1562019.1 lysophospholipase [Alkalihalobacillus alcalophilus]